jgi:prepilin signal peptidase PulO-like enzyme (type II secretory pathway)
MWRRVVVILMGMWLATSALAWPHTPAQSWNAILVGAVIAVSGALSLADDRANYVSVALAVWLFLSMFVFKRAAPATFWNNVFVAFFVFELSVSDSRRIYRSHARKGMAAGDSAVQ